MTQTAQCLLEQFEALDESDQAELSGIIGNRQAIRSDIEYVSAWSAELRERIDRHESSLEPEIPWEQLRKQLMEKDERGE